METRATTIGRRRFFVLRGPRWRTLFPGPGGHQIPRAPSSPDHLLSSSLEGEKGEDDAAMGGRLKLDRVRESIRYDPSIGWEGMSLGNRRR